MRDENPFKLKKTPPRPPRTVLDVIQDSPVMASQPRL